MEVAISEAAVSFVASGYDTNSSDKCDKQAPDNIPLPLEKLDDEKIHSANDIIAKAFISELLSSSLEIGATHLPGLDKIAVTSMILSPGLNIEKIDIDHVKEVINGITKDHLITCFKSITNFSSVEDSLSTLAHCCRKQWNKEAACAIFAVAVRLLCSKRNTSTEKPAVVSLLALLIIYAGKCCEKMTLLMPHEEDENGVNFLFMD